MKHLTLGPCRPWAGRPRLRHLLPTVALGTVLATAGCAAPESDASGATAAEPSASVSALTKDDAAAALLPDAIRAAGVVRVASGISYPPMEYYASDNKTVLGFDADLGKALGDVLGVKFDFQNTNFDGILGGLAAGRYDLSLTSMIDKEERYGTVDFVDYLKSGDTFMVKKGNPVGLEEADDLCGHKVAVEKSTTGDLSAEEVSKECVADGNPKIEIHPFPDQASAVQALQSGRADAVMALDLTLAYAIKQDPDSFEVPAEPFGAFPIGIAIAKDKTDLRDAVQAALLKVQEAGVYDQLLAKWNLTDQALKGAQVNQGK